MMTKMVVGGFALTGAVSSYELGNILPLLKPWKYPQAYSEEERVREGEVELDLKFQAYATKFGKQYANQDEYQFRKDLFAQIDRYIVEWNSNPSNTHTLGHNHFSDMTVDEKK